MLTEKVNEISPPLLIEEWRPLWVVKWLRQVKNPFGIDKSEILEAFTRNLPEM